MPSCLPSCGQFEDLRQLTEFGLSHRQMLQMKTAFVCGTGVQGDTWNKASEVVACCESNGSCFAAMPDAPELVEKSAVETPAVVEE